MATYVLVHGAWAGAHGFRELRPLLWRQGHEVFTPALTGIGERHHVTGPQVTLRTHVQDVVNLVLYEDLTDVVLLGFSYGGAVVCAALDALGDRVRELVLLDAFLPRDGESVLTLLGHQPPGPAGGPGPATLGVPWELPPAARPLDDPADRAWSDARRTPQPLGTFAEPVRISRPLEDRDLGLTYVKATADPGEQPDSPFWRAAEQARSSPAWRYHEIATHHLVPLSRPQELAAILLALA
jgi:pimeloyl-ACP methyl ester carboxylesterase